MHCLRQKAVDAVERHAAVLEGFSTCDRHPDTGMSRLDQLFAVRFEENATLSNEKLIIYLGCVETGKINVCGQRGDNDTAWMISVKNEESCTLLVNNLLWGLHVKTSLVLAPEQAFVQGFEALEEAWTNGKTDSLSAFQGIPSRTEIQEYVKQVRDVAVA